MNKFQVGDLIKIQAPSDMIPTPWHSGEWGLVVSEAGLARAVVGGPEQWWKVMVGTDCDWVHEDLLVKIEDNNEDV